MECTGLNGDMATEEAFLSVLDYSALWIQLFRCSGRRVKELWEHPLFKKAKESVEKVCKAIDNSDITCKLFLSLQEKKKICISVFSCAVVPDDKHHANSWSKLEKNLKTKLSNFDELHNVLMSVKKHVNNDDLQDAIKDCLMFWSKKIEDIKTGTVTIMDIDQFVHQSDTVQGILKKCSFLQDLLSSAVFWNIFHQDETKFYQGIKSKSVVEEDNILSSVAYLFDDHEHCQEENEAFSYAYMLLEEICEEGVNVYKEFWHPLLHGGDMPLEIVLLGLQGVDFNKEIKQAQEFHHRHMNDATKQSLKSILEYQQYAESVSIMQKALAAFCLDFQEDEDFSKAVLIYKRLKQEDLQNMTLKSIQGSLQVVKNVSSLIKDEVKEILAEVGRSSSLIDFLRTVVDDDIRNLIDAVEEHSEQYVRESTVSDLIAVKRFFRPLLKEDFQRDTKKFFQMMKKSVESSGIKDIPAKIFECSSSLHSLKALYNHVANRGEVTKEMIENILSKGKFHFFLQNGVCEIRAEYKQKVQQGKQVSSSYTTAALNDLRSRALLIMNSEEKQKENKQTTSTTGNRDTFPRFVELVDTCLRISSLYSSLKQSGHFMYTTFDTRVILEQDLKYLESRLQSDYDEWCDSLEKCRKTYYYMNFIHGDQIQLIYNYILNGSDEQLSLAVLRYIDPKVNSVKAMREKYKNAIQNKNPDVVLDVIGKGIHFLCSSLTTTKRKFSIESQKVKATEIVQEGKLYIAGLEEDSSLVIRTLMSLYLNTTGELPQPSQVMFCRRDTSVEELILLLNRCLGSKVKALFCIANIEKLTDENQFRLAEELVKLPTAEKFLLCVICRGNSHHTFLDQFVANVMHPRPLTEVQLRNCFESHWPKVATITSEVPGLGKSECIHALAAMSNRTATTLHISGPFDRKTLIRRFVAMNPKAYNLLHIDIGIVEEPDELDILLFEMIVTGYVTAGTNTFSLSTDIICIEIANSANNKLRDTLPTVTSFRRTHLKWEDYDNMKVCQEMCSPVQVVCTYLQALEKGTLDQKDLYFTGSKREQPISPTVCRTLLRKYFSTTADMTFSVLNVFLDVLADQLKKLSTSMFFRTTNLQQLSARSQLVKALLQMSQDFSSRSIHTCRSSQISTMKTTGVDHEEIDMSNSQMSGVETLAKRVEGMIRWEDENHLMVLFHEDMNTVSALYRNCNNVPKEIKDLFESQLNRALSPYEKKTQEQLQAILQKLVCIEEQPTSAVREMSKRYALTPDNLLKMILIFLRITAHQPVVIMGETGCGKTSLIRFLATTCEIELHVMSIHSGITEEKIVSIIETCNQKAKKHLSNQVWLFLDEINTCDHLGIIADVICHHKCLGKSLVPNLTILAACNPYKLRNTSAIFTAGLQGKIKADELSRLVYRVHPLPESLVDYVWDYGSLSSTDEGKYIERMVSSVFSREEDTRLLGNLLKVSQQFVRETEGNSSSVSLRDVDRCRRLVLWFLKILPKKQAHTALCVPHYVAKNSDFTLRSIVLALAVCYHSRFAENVVRREYRKRMISEVKTSKYSWMTKTEDDILKIISSEQDDVLNRMDLPEGIAKNTALRENVFVIFVCILNRIPVFVVGKPGCSKSLSMQLIRSNLRGKDSLDPFFKMLPQLYCVSFQGSESSTSDGIIKVFDKANNYQKHNSDDVMSVVILDEIGLAEISKFNPLKVLHSLLEPEDKPHPDVAVVGISNWALDAAKMNRAIHLSRPEMDSEELYQTSLSINLSMKGQSQESEHSLLICKQKPTLNVSEKEQKLLRALADVFNEYNRTQKFKNFHGLRDFYSLTKHVSKEICRPGQNFTEEEIQNMVIQGIQRNFGGLDYVPMAESLYQECGFTCHEKESVLDLIHDNIEDRSARHLMLITNGDSVIGVMEKMLKDIGRNHLVIFGSQFERDQTDEYYYRILSRIILCMEQGYCLILKDLENIYGSLYDMLNQNYTVVGKKKNCRVALGPYSNPMCHVHEDFKCIVIVEETKLDYSDPPFLNRFEKQRFQFMDMLTEIGQLQTKNLEEIVAQISTIEGQTLNVSDTFAISTEEMLPSLVMSVMSSNKSVVELQLQDYVRQLLWITFPEAIVRLERSEIAKSKVGLMKMMIKTYKELPIHDGLAAFLQFFMKGQDGKKEKVEKPCDVEISMEKDENQNTEIDKPLELVEEASDVKDVASRQYAVFTHSNMHVNLKAVCGSQNVQCERLGVFRSERAFASRIQHFFDSDKDLLVVQCSNLNDAQHILLAKTTIEEIERKSAKDWKNVCMIFHLERIDGEARVPFQINFLSGWTLGLVDTLEKPRSNFTSLFDASVLTVLQQRRPITKPLKEQLFWSLTRIHFSGTGHTIQSMMALLSSLQSSTDGLMLLEEAIFDWIESKTEDNNWQLDIATNLTRLRNASSFIYALEGHLSEMIRIPLAKLLFRLCDMNAIHCILSEDDNQQKGRLSLWRSLVKDEHFILLKSVPEPTCPECYVCNSMALEMKMPFSYTFILTIEKLKEDYVDMVKQVKIACELEEGNDISDCQNDAELPSKVFNSLGSKYSDVILQSVPEITTIQYAGREEDFLDDFSNYTTAYQVNHLNKQDRILATQWSLAIFMDLKNCTFEDLIPWLHLLQWTYGHITCTMVQIMDEMSNVMKLSVQTITKRVELALTKEDSFPDQHDRQTEENSVSDLTRRIFVETVSSEMMPSHATLMLFESMKSWRSLTRRILPLLGVVSLDANSLHLLRFCSDLCENVFLPHSIPSKRMEDIGDALLKDGEIDSPDMYQQVMNLLQSLKEGNVEASTLNKILCSYVGRCLAVDPESAVFLWILESIGTEREVDPKLTFLGSLLNRAFLMELSEEDDVAFKLLSDDFDIDGKVFLGQFEQMFVQIGREGKG